MTTILLAFMSDAAIERLIQGLFAVAIAWIGLKQQIEANKAKKRDDKIEEVHGLVNGLAQKREDAATATGKANTDEAVRQGVENAQASFAEGQRTEHDKPTTSGLDKTLL